MKRVFCLMALLAVTVAGDQVFAQARGLGRFGGTVVDESGQLLAGVSVKATPSDVNTDTGIETKSDDKGEWAVGGVGKGSWRVVFSKPGYAPIAAKVVLEQELGRVPPIKITLKKS